MSGAQDYNVAPFVPIGMEILFHDKSQKRRTSSEHCSKGWVLGNLFEHYHSWTMWMKTTQVLRISATVFHKHKFISNPAVTPAYQVLANSGA